MLCTTLRASMGYTVGADDYPEVIFGKDDGVQVTDTTQNVVRSVVKIYSNLLITVGVLILVTVREL